MTDRAGARARLWTPRRVAWYERASAGSDYAARVLEALAGVLAACRSVLDVGAGFGALALPLARRLDIVTAVEPSPAMAAALRAAIAREGLANVTVLATTWEEARPARHDLVVCAHVAHLLDRDAPFLAEVSALARRAVALVRDAPGAGDKFFFRELYPRLRGRPYGRPGRTDGGWEATAQTLTRHGLVPTVMPLVYDSDQPFASLEEACDFWMEYMELEDDAARRFLRGFLAERLVRRGDGGWLAPFRKRAMVLTWSTT